MIEETKRDEPLKIYEKIIFRVISSVLLTCILNMINSVEDWKNIHSVESIDTISMFLTIWIFFCMFSLVDIFIKKININNIDALFFCVLAVLMGFMMMITLNNIYTAVTTTFFVLIGIFYVMNRFPYTVQKISISKKQSIAIISVLLIITLFYLGALVVLRYYLFRTSTFDFGIFSQMYYYMKETGAPMTTCERDMFLSHFAVHFSPIFYIILPIYCIIPHPVTIIIMQLLVVFSGVVPLYLICKNRKFSNFITMGMVAVYILYPTMRGGLFYDFHENKFLAVMLLWLIYFLDKENLSMIKRNIGIAVFVLLSLMVKEDAAIYVACLGLFNLVYKKEKSQKITGAVITVFSIIYFFVVLYLLGKYGLGTFVGRYDNLMVSVEDGLTGMVINMIKNPAYVISQLFKAEKMAFLLWTMVPLMFLPFRQKKLSAYILMIPALVMNYLTDYVYQYDIGFQYTYGSCTLLIYLAVISFEGRESIKKKKTMIAMLVASLILTTSALANKNFYFEEAENYLETNKEIIALFDTIPKEASVRVSTMYLPQLSMRDEVYWYEADVETDYIVHDMRDKEVRERYLNNISKLVENGYEVYAEIENKVLILVKKVD